MDFDILQPIANPYSSPPGPVLITCPIVPHISGYFTVRVNVYQGSIWPWAGAILDTLETVAYFNSGVSKNVQVIHQSTLTSNSRRDVGVIIYDEFTSPENPIASNQFDDVFYVTTPTPTPTPEFSGLITSIAPTQIQAGKPIDIAINFNAYTESTLQQINGWWTRVVAKADSYGDYDAQFHTGRDGSRTGQQLHLGTMPQKNLSGTVQLQAHVGGVLTIEPGEDGQWVLLDTKNFAISYTAIPTPTPTPTPVLPPSLKKTYYGIPLWEWATLGGGVLGVIGVIMFVSGGKKHG